MCFINQILNTNLQLISRLLLQNRQFENERVIHIKHLASGKITPFGEISFLYPAGVPVSLQHGYWHPEGLPAQGQVQKQLLFNFYYD